MAISHENYDPSLKAGATTKTDDIANGSITGVKLSTGIGYFTAAVDVDNTSTEQSFFGISGLGIASTITGVLATSLDATVATISLVNGQASVTTMVLGGVATSTVAGPFTLMASKTVGATSNLFVEASSDASYSVIVSFTTG